VLTIILGLFTVIGFLGIRDIANLRTKYSTELESLTKTKKEFDERATALEAQRRAAEDQFKQIAE